MPPSPILPHLPPITLLLALSEATTIAILHSSSLPPFLKATKVLSSAAVLLFALHLNVTVRTTPVESPAHKMVSKRLVKFGWYLVALSVASAFVAPMLLAGGESSAPTEQEEETAAEDEEDLSAGGSDGSSSSFLLMFALIAASLTRASAGVALIKSPSCLPPLPPSFSAASVSSVGGPRGSGRLGTTSVRSERAAPSGGGFQSRVPFSSSSSPYGGDRSSPRLPPSLPSSSEPTSLFTEPDWAAADEEMIQLGIELSRRQHERERRAPAAAPPSAGERREKLNRMRQKFRTKKELHEASSSSPSSPSSSPSLPPTSNSCAICLDGMTGSSSNKVLECGHAFHLQCVWSWIDSKGESRCFCPICRHRIDRGAL